MPDPGFCRHWRCLLCALTTVAQCSVVTALTLRKELPRKIEPLKLAGAWVRLCPSLRAFRGLPFIFDKVCAFP